MGACGASASLVGRAIEACTGSSVRSLVAGPPVAIDHEDASRDSEPRSPARLSLVGAAISALVAVFVHSTRSYAQPGSAMDAEETALPRWLSRATGMLSLVGLLYEVVVGASIRMLGTSAAAQEDPHLRRRKSIGARAAAAFLALAVLSHYAAADGEPRRSRSGWLAERYGGRQHICGIQQAACGLAAPFLLSALGYRGRARSARPRGLVASAALVGVCRLVAFQGLVVEDIFAAWLCSAWACFGNALASVNLMLLATRLQEAPDAAPDGRVRAQMLVFFVAMLGCLSAVSLLPILGLIAPAVETILLSIANACLAIGTIATVAVADVAWKEGARSAAASSASALREVMDGIGLPVIGVDRGGRVEGVNAKADHQADHLTGMLSHELRSPLHGAMNLARSLQVEERDPEKARMLKMIADTTSRLLDTVNENMEVASTGAESPTEKRIGIQLQRGPVDIAMVVEDMVALVRTSVGKAGEPVLSPGVSLRNDVKCLPIIEADAHWFGQVFYSVIALSCEYTSAGCITVLPRVDPRGRWVEIVVKDTGRGISRASLAQLLQPGLGELPRAAVVGQEGLSLPTVQAILRMHGGFLDVDSEVGAGSTFSVRLPTMLGAGADEVGAITLTTDALVAPERIAQDEEEEDDDDYDYEYDDDHFLLSCSSGEVSPAGSCRSERRPWVLSVDDDAISQLVVQRYLEDDYEVFAAMDGSLALERLERQRAHLPCCALVADVMPELPGREVCRIIREDLGIDAASLPILMVSSDNYPAAQAKALRCGCNGVIVKPFGKEALLSLIASVAHAALR